MKKGFTLIELLVVVLIIGILSSVALPQYTKAVEKSRAAEAIATLKSLRDAQEICFMENGIGTAICTSQDSSGNNLFNSSSVTIGGTPRTCSGCGPETKNWRFQISNAFIEAHRTNGKLYLTTTAAPAYQGRPAYQKTVCRAEGSGTAADCKAIGFTVDAGSGAYSMP